MNIYWYKLWATFDSRGDRRGVRARIYVARGNPYYVYEGFYLSHRFKIPVQHAYDTTALYYLYIVIFIRVDRLYYKRLVREFYT